MLVSHLVNTPGRSWNGRFHPGRHSWGWLVSVRLDPNVDAWAASFLVGGGCEVPLVAVRAKVVDGRMLYLCKVSQMLLASLSLSELLVLACPAGGRGPGLLRDEE